MKVWLFRIILVACFAGLSIAYLSPGFTPVFEGDVSRVMSDGTDSATVPYYYATLREVLRDRPAELFYGAVPARHLNAPEGFALWIPWSERFIALVAGAFVPVEHVSTVFVGALMLFNALCMYALGRSLGWSRALSFALAVAWAFSPFTRARAQVHMGFAGTYHIPLALLSTLWALKGRTWRSLTAASLGFLFVGMAPHYFVITLAFLSPFLIFIGWSLTEAKGRRPVLRLALAALPMVVLLGWCFLMPLPADLVAKGAASLPPSGQTEGGGPHSFLFRYAAHPVDYFTGDIGLGEEDWNWWRGDLTHDVLMHLDGSNPHERANGIRWVIWALVSAGLFYRPRERRRTRIAILVFGLFAFWLSLAPDAVPFVIGPSYWLYSLVSQIRVPSRAGIFVHFAALLSAGVFVHALSANLKGYRRYAVLALPLLILLELPPFAQDMRLYSVRPRLTSLDGEDCGTGMYFPYVAGNWGVLQSYYFLQEMRGTKCGLINRVWPDLVSEKMYRAMGLSQNMMNAFNAQSPDSMSAVLRFAKCAPLSFLVFDPQTDPRARAKLCEELGWSMSEPRVCRRSGLVLNRNPAECF